jgi:PPOX class F420-dependent enzyme/OxyR family protein
MSVFSDAELTYLAQGKLRRLATIDAGGMPHVVPLGWRYNPALDTIDVGGRNLARTRKFHNAQRNPNVALVIDDVLPPWRPPVRDDPRYCGGAPGCHRARWPASRAYHPAAPSRSDQLGNGVRRRIGGPPQTDHSQSGDPITRRCNRCS